MDIALISQCEKWHMAREAVRKISEGAAYHPTSYGNAMEEFLTGTVFKGIANGE